MNIKLIGLIAVMSLSFAEMQAQINASTDVLSTAVNSQEKSGQLQLKYEVGDIYDYKGVRGYVIEVDVTGQHGLLLSLDRFEGKWANEKKLKIEGDFSETDGFQNMKIIEKFLAERKEYEGALPFYDWCRKKGEGWYMPSVKELEKVVTLFNGSMGKFKKSNYEKYDKIFVDNGGDGLLRNKFPLIMFSSNLASNGKVMCACGLYTPTHMVIEKVNMNPKNQKVMGSRAMYRF